MSNKVSDMIAMCLPSAWLRYVWSTTVGVHVLPVSYCSFEKQMITDACCCLLLLVCCLLLLLLLAA